MSFSRRFGDLDDIKRYMGAGRKPRYSHYELFDAGNVAATPPSSSSSSTTKAEPEPLDPSSPRAHANRGNALFHADSSFNPRRASFSLLRAARLPPPETGGDTWFADSRRAAEELDGDIVALLRGAADEDEKTVKEEKGKGGKGLVGVHSMAHSRKLGSPAFFADLDPHQWPMFRHPILQEHGPSGRVNLYVGAHLHHIETPSPPSSSPDRGEEIPNSAALVSRLNAHATQDKYVVAVRWENVGDLVIWDNRAVLHRAGPGSFEGRFVRDLRRTTVHDDSVTAWGFNEVGSAFPAFFTAPGPAPIVVADGGGDGGVGDVKEGGKEGESGDAR